MSERDELVDLIEDSIDDAIYDAADAPPSLVGIVASHATDAILAAGYRKPRTITTAEELDALKFGSVVVDRAGVARTKRRSDSAMPGGWTAGGRSPIPAALLVDGNEMTVLYEPTP
jgi:hypothetical protein